MLSITEISFPPPNFYAFIFNFHFFFSFSLKHLEEKAKAHCEALNGPLEDAAAMDEAK